GVDDGPDGADSVAYDLGAQRSGAGRLRIAGVATAEPAALLEDRGAARAVDRAVAPAAACEPRVRGVHDRVDLLGRDVADGELDHARIDPHGRWPAGPVGTVPTDGPRQWLDRTAGTVPTGSEGRG